MSKRSITAELIAISHNLLQIRRPVVSGLEPHLHAAVDWLLNAQTVNNDGGISASYKLILGQWSPSYPETTGYTIPTLLSYAERYQRTDVLNAALKMAEYELNTQLPTGGFPKLKKNPSEKDQPVSFDTGQVIFGLISTYKQTNDNGFLESANRAGEWLVAQQTKAGNWLNYNNQKGGGTIDSLISLALLQLFILTRNNKFKESACKQLDWVLQQQQMNGYFNNCSFYDNNHPNLHMIAYTIEGLMESGIFLDDDGYLSAATKVADIILNQVSVSGYIPGVYDEDWRPTVWWSCLTGNAQMARIWARLGKITDNPKYIQSAELALNFIASTQYIDHMPDNIRGGISGSWPIYGKYMNMKYPNWAASYFANAILTLQ